MRSFSPLTIVHVVFSSRIAGAERHVLDLAAAQAEAGHVVHIVGPRYSALQGAVPSGVTYHGLATALFRGARLQALVQRLGADVCHGHLGPACRNVAQCDGLVRVGTLHVGFKSHQHQWLDGLICVNPAQRDLVVGCAGEVRVIPNWPPRMPSRRQVSDVRAELGLGHDRVLVGTVARLHPSKGVDVLIRAFLAHADLNASLIVMGEGKEARRLRRLAAGDPRIHLLGFRDDVDAILRSIDLFVSPSREEALPLAVLEAMRAELPIIATRTQGAVQLLASERATLVPINDAAALGAAIGTAVRSMAPHGRMAQRWRVRYNLAPYDRDLAAARVDAFYRALLGQATPLEALAG